VREVSVHDIVVGDVVVVEAGDKVAADGVLLEYYDVTANESSLTGEYIYICMYVCVCVCLCVHINLYIYIYIYVCVCVCGGGSPGV
jgi:hypothetical protein